ncbi:MAG: 30S ribosomal protein S12 methylthiotransferase RimO [Elusimicrobiota bacterium]|jgi:ribosomal protein S12 methylthiotransferase|nr:30S ribosomal protein S12 methylthiotransferase RimO [Elusimicrobiota bacterium]
MIKKAQNAALIVLGCPKNIVEAEYLSGILRNKGFNIVSQTDDADIIVIHTCSFIEVARRESESFIRKVLELKKRKSVKVFVSGCLAQLLKDEMLKKFSGIDGYVGTGCLDKLPSMFSNNAVNSSSRSYLSPGGLNNSKFRILSSLSPSAYLKIAEGCNHKCSFCIIPDLRGKYQSRTIESLIDEAKSLANAGVKELAVIAQDTTSYGIDIYDKFALSNLLKKLSKIKFKWIRLLYAYPNGLTGELLNVINDYENICSYIDIPIQHISKKILSAMHRPINTRSVIEKINKKYPNIILRTSLIAGFPGEKKADVKELIDFLKEGHFLYAGVFKYSNNKKAKSSDFDGQIDAKTIKIRKELLENVQYEAFKSRVEKLKNKEIEMLIENVVKYRNVYRISGRAQFQAPEIDGKISFTNGKELEVGSFQKVFVEGNAGYTIKARREIK